MTELVIWTITTGTKDFGARYVARPHRIVPGGSSALDEFFVADTLEAVRAMLPPGLHCLGREPGDHAVIIENWI